MGRKVRCSHPFRHNLRLNAAGTKWVSATEAPPTGITTTPGQLLSSARSGCLAPELMRRGKLALVTDSGGLIGSKCARVLCQEGWNVAGTVNDMRSWFFGEADSTAPVAKALQENFLLTGTPRHPRPSSDTRPI
jgi:hypothetical protein